jgi:hypothetical protein
MCRYVGKWVELYFEIHLITCFPCRRVPTAEVIFANRMQVSIREVEYVTPWNRALLEKAMVTQLFWNVQVHYHTNKSPSLNRILCQSTLSYISLKCILILA